MRKLGITCLVAILVAVNIFIPVKVEAQTLREAYNELAKMKKEAQYNQNQQGNTQDQINKTIADIQKMAANIESTKREISTLKEEIEELKQEMIKKDAELAELAAFQQVSNGETAYLEYALDTESMTDFVYRIAVVKQLMEYNANLLKEMEQNIKSNEEKTKKLAEQEVSFAKQKVELEKKSESLEVTKERLEVGYTSILQDIEIQQALLEDAEARGCDMDQDISSCGNVLPNNSKLYRPTTGYRVTSIYDPSGTHESRQDLPLAWRPHAGLDVGANSGTNVYALGYGVVTAVSYEKCGGNFIWIAYRVNNKIYSSGYFHLSKQLVKPGDSVSPNTIVGKVGSTGNCTTGPHLHFEMTRGARYAVVPKSPTKQCLFGIPAGQCYTDGVSKWRFDPRTMINLPGYWQRFDGR